MLERVQPLPAESVDIEAALGRVLVEDATSSVDLPPFDSSAMDGFALRSADTPGQLTVVHRIPAGAPAPRSLEPGDFYVLIPPRDDIHRVRTTSAETSVSIHLLTNDTGCVWRHAWDTAYGEARPFRSGYVNVPCDD